MRSNNRIPRLIQWWFTPKLPVEHIFISKDKRPKSGYQIFRVYFRKWIIHPIKRRMAKYYLWFLQKFFGITVIAITGSAGKTTVKEMIASILSRKGETVATYKNIDPVYNIPTTILKCRPRTRYLVLEMGVEFPEEMDYYLWMAKPVIGVITNIYPTHTEFFKSVKGVFREKVKLLKKLPKEGYAVLNIENPYLKKASKIMGAKIVWFGRNGDIKAENLVLTTTLKTKYDLIIGMNKISVQIPIPGKQFVENSLAAASVSYLCGASMNEIKKGFLDYKKPKHRMRIVKLKSGTLLLDDSYNNNPIAAKKSIETLKDVAGLKQKILVFGDMLELGKLEERYHRELGDYIAIQGVDYLIGVGPASKFTVKEASKEMEKGKTYWVPEQKEVDLILTPLLQKNKVLMIKGSRFIGLDKLVSRLS